MRFATRLKINSYCSFGILLIFLPIIAWILLSVRSARQQDALAEQLFTVQSERIDQRNEHALFHDETRRSLLLAETEQFGRLLDEADRTLSNGTKKKEILADIRRQFTRSAAMNTQLAQNSTSPDEASESHRSIFRHLVICDTALEASIRNLRDLVEEERDRYSRNGIMIAALLVIVLTAALTGNYRFINRVMRDRLAVLQSGAAKIAGGALETRIDTGEVDEFAELATSINDMTAQLRHHLHDLERSHSLFTQLTRQVPGIIFQARLHPDGHFSIPFASDHITSLYGLTPDAVCNDATAIFERFHPEERTSLIASIHDSARNLSTWRQEFRFIQPDGSLRWCLGIAQPQALADGSTCWDGFISDITEHKSSAQQIQMYNDTFDTAFDAIHWVSPEGRIIHANATACRMLGYTLEEITTLTVGDLDPVFPFETFPLVWEDFKQRGGGTFETIHRTRDGRDIPVEIAVSYRSYAESDLNCCIVRDISERKRSVGELRESNRRFSAIFQHSPIAIGLSYLPSGEFIDINDSFLALYGYTRDEIIGHTALGIGLWTNPEERERMMSILRAQGRVDRYEMHLRHKSGNIRTLLMSAELFDHLGQTLMIGMLVDITERKQAELKLTELNANLETQVRERTADVSSTNERLLREIEDRRNIERELIDKNQLLESLSIDLAMAEERERDRIAGELHDQVGQRLIFGKMALSALAERSEGAQMPREISALENVLDLTIQDVRTLTFQLRPPLLASAGLEAALHWLGGEFQENHGLAVHYSNDGQPKPLRYEARSIVFQAAREVLLNTAKHAEASRIEIDIKRCNSSLLLQLGDDGRGFEPDKAAARSGRNGGFGLQNVRRRIEHLDGTVAIESWAGGGTRVTLSVPLDIPAEEHLFREGDESAAS